MEEDRPRRTLLFEFVDDVLVGVHSPEPPTSAEWAAFVEAGTKSGARCSVVYTAGGGPNAKQRADMLKALDGRPHPTAVLTESVFARNLITAVGWFGKDIKGFSPQELEAAMEYVGRSQLTPAVRHTLAKMRRLMGDVR